MRLALALTSAQADRLRKEADRLGIAPAVLARATLELSRTMWATEYELQEPSAEGRAIDPAAVERMFDATRGAHISPGEFEHIWRGQSGPPADRAWPDPAGAWYCTGIDWAQKRDSTVAAVVRCDTTPLQLVARRRCQRTCHAWVRGPSGREPAF